MAASRKRQSAEDPVLGAARALLARVPLEGERLAVGLSGGLDSVVLLDVLHRLAPEFGYRLQAIHVHHGLSPHAGAWARFCRDLCRRLRVPFACRRVRVDRRKLGLEAGARRARQEVFRAAKADVLALAHHADDQAETVLLQLFRGTGLAGARGMPSVGRLGDKRLLRPLLGVSRAQVAAHAARRRLAHVEDESNADTALARNFLRHRIGPLLDERFPKWRENVGRAALKFAEAELGGERLLRAFLAEQGLRAPSEAKLADMLRQFSGEGRRTAIAHDGAVLRTYRGRVLRDTARPGAVFKALAWGGEARVRLQELGGEIRFRRRRGAGIDVAKLRDASLGPRRAGARLQPDPKRPRRSLKNLFQEAGIPPWERDRLPMLYSGDDLVWVPGLGIDCRYAAEGRAPGLVPEWRVA